MYIEVGSHGYTSDLASGAIIGRDPVIGNRGPVIGNRDLVIGRDPAIGNRDLVTLRASQGANRSA